MSITPAGLEAGLFEVAVKLLTTGDIHIGRRPTRIEDAGAERWSCARIWGTIVERAVSESVDAVLLSGDVIDHDNRFFEATGPLEQGIMRLAERGISTFAVSGNHDHDVLHRLADSIASNHFRVLGRGGRWEEAELLRDGRPVLRLHGWSFPAPLVRVSPMREYDLAGGDDLPTLGLLHADLDDMASRYAPLGPDELRRPGVHFWILGHIHKPRLRASPGTAPVLYPGSPQAMDPAEPGNHGAWLIEIEGPRSIQARLIPLSKVRYETLGIDLEGVAGPEEFEARVVGGVRSFLNAATTENPELELLSLRLALHGRTGLGGEIDRMAAGLPGNLRMRLGTGEARIETVTNDTVPDIDLSGWATRSDPPGQLARLLLRLQSGEWDEETEGLARRAHRGMLQCYDASAYAPVGGDSRPASGEVRDLLQRQGRRILDAMREQRAVE